MAGTSPFSDIPTSGAQVIASQNPDSPTLAIDLNRIQAAMIQEKLRKGQVTPEQVVAWRAANGTTPVTLPSTVAAPTVGGHTAIDVPLGTTAPQAPHELTWAQQQQIAREMQKSTDQIHYEIAAEGGPAVVPSVGQVHNLNVSSEAPPMNDKAG